MFEKIPAPVKGQPARASWGSALTSRVNELCAMAPARGLARDGLTGTGFAALPSNRRERSVAKIPGCFDIRRPSPAASEGGEADPGGFDNPYFMVGANLYQCAEAIDMGFDYDDCILALCVNTTSESPQAFVDVFVDFTAIQEAAKSRSVAIHPLYLIGKGGGVLADLRNIPVFPQWEYKAN